MLQALSDSISLIASVKAPPHRIDDAAASTVENSDELVRRGTASPASRAEVIRLEACMTAVVQFAAKISISSMDNLIYIALLHLVYSHYQALENRGAEDVPLCYLAQELLELLGLRDSHHFSGSHWSFDSQWARSFWESLNKDQQGYFGYLLRTRYNHSAEVDETRLFAFEKLGHLSRLCKVIRTIQVPETVSSCYYAMGALLTCPEDQVAPALSDLLNMDTQELKHVFRFAIFDF